MYEEDHPTGMITNGCIGIGCEVVKELFYFIHGFRGCSGLFGSNIAKGDKYCVVYGNGIVQKNDYYFLDNFYSFFWKERCIVLWFRNFYFGALCWCNMVVWG